MWEPIPQPMGNYYGDLLSLIVRDIVRFGLLGIILAVLLYFFYPLIRYHYTHEYDSHVVVRIDRFTGEAKFLSLSINNSGQVGWLDVPGSKGK